MWLYLLLFTLGTITDCVYCRGVQCMAERQTWAAVFYNFTLGAIGLVSSWTVIKLDSIPLAVTYLVGGMLGTYLTTKGGLK